MGGDVFAAREKTIGARIAQMIEAGMLEEEGIKGGRGAKGCAKLGSKNCDPLGRLMDGKRMGQKAVEHFHKIKADIHKELHGN